MSKNLFIFFLFILLVSCNKESTEDQLQKKNTLLQNSSWLFSKYTTENGVLIYQNDTILFTESEKYSVNNGSIKAYEIVENGMSYYSLDLKSFPSLGGDWFAKLPHSFFEDGEINNTKFIKTYNGGDTVKVWMERIN